MDLTHEPLFVIYNVCKGGVELGAKSVHTLELASFLKQASRIGYGKAEKEFLAIIQKIVKKSHPMRKFIGKGW